MRLDRRSLFMAMAGATIAGPGTLGAGRARAQGGAARPATGGKSPWVRNTRGKLLYIGDDDKERGREWFSFSYREDGQVTLRAYCEIDDGRVERDVVQTMTPEFHPLDCFVRLHVGGKFLGTGWIRVSEDEAECEVYSAALGRVRQVVPLKQPATSLVSHPLSSDSLLMAGFDHSKPDRIQRWGGGLSTSPLLDGASGPLISVGGERGTEYVGAERITTPAGTFDTHHYRMLMNRTRADGTKTAYEIWCTHPDYVFIRGEVRGYLNNKTGSGYYELVEWEA